MMNKQQVYEFLRQKGVWFEITEHKAVFSAAESHEVPMPYPSADSINLFLRDDKRRNFYLITTHAAKHIDLKQFRHTYGTRSLSFGSPDDLMERMGLLPGSVTPMGLLNDPEHKVQFYFDEYFLEEPGIFGLHPNENTATVWMKTQDLIDILTEFGTPMHIVHFDW